MSTRRQFLKQMSLGVAAGALGLPIISDPLFTMPALEPQKGLKIALLADAHLPSASPETVAAKNLLTAVAEINAQNPPVDLVFFAGDLTDNGDKKAFELGKDIIVRPKCPMLAGARRTRCFGCRQPARARYCREYYFFVRTPRRSFLWLQYQLSLTPRPEP